MWTVSPNTRGRSIYALTYMYVCVFVQQIKSVNEQQVKKRSGKRVTLPRWSFDANPIPATQIHDEAMYTGQVHQISRPLFIFQR